MGGGGSGRPGSPQGAVSFEWCCLLGYSFALVHFRLDSLEILNWLAKLHPPSTTTKLRVSFTLSSTSTPDPWNRGTHHRRIGHTSKAVKAQLIACRAQASPTAYFDKDCSSNHPIPTRLKANLTPRMLADPTCHNMFPIIRTATHKLRESCQTRFAILHHDQALGAQHRRFGQMNRAMIAQLAARRSRNPKVVNSILTHRIY